VGKTIWNKEVIIKAINNIVTKMDEAFALLVLENSYEVWFQEEKACHDRTMIPTEQKKNLKYTEKLNRARKHEDWEQGGILAFNQLTDKSDWDHTNNATFNED